MMTPGGCGQISGDNGGGDRGLGRWARRQELKTGYRLVCANSRGINPDYRISGPLNETRRSDAANQIPTHLAKPNAVKPAVRLEPEGGPCQARRQVTLQQIKSNLTPKTHGKSNLLFPHEHPLGGHSVRFRTWLKFLTPFPFLLSTLSLAHSCNNQESQVCDNGRTPGEEATCFHASSFPTPEQTLEPLSTKIRRRKSTHKIWGNCSVCWLGHLRPASMVIYVPKPCRISGAATEGTH